MNPLRRILIHHPNVKRDADRFAEQAEQVDVARAVIKRQLDELDDTREHPDDRAERRVEKALAGHNLDTDAGGLDYSDPTGTTAISAGINRRWEKMTGDLEALQDLEAELRDTMGHMLAIARSYLGPDLADEPQCETCGQAAEPTGNDRRKFRGARKIGGEWVRREHGRPVVCRGCRAKVERGAA